jgi:hypothetical protein
MKLRAASTPIAAQAKVVGKTGFFRVQLGK